MGCVDHARNLSCIHLLPRECEQDIRQHVVVWARLVCTFDTVLYYSYSNLICTILLLWEKNIFLGDLVGSLFFRYLFAASFAARYLSKDRYKRKYNRVCTVYCRRLDIRVIRHLVHRIYHIACNSVVVGGIWRCTGSWQGKQKSYCRQAAPRGECTKHIGINKKRKAFIAKVFFLLLMVDYDWTLASRAPVHEKALKE